MSRILVLTLMISTYAFASGGAEGAGTDIVQRTVNFLLFAGLIWYLIAEPVKSYFAGRSQGIADELNKVQDRLNESDFEQRKMIRNVVENVIDEVLTQSSGSFDKEAMANVILKKVA